VLYSWVCLEFNVINNKVKMNLFFLILLLITTTTTNAALKPNEEVNLLEVLQRLPMIAPFLSTKVGSVCKTKINAFSTEITRGVEELKGKKQSYMPVVKKAWCLLGRKCTEEMVASTMALISGGGFIEQMVKTQLPEGFDVKDLDKVVLAYYANYCENIGRGAEMNGADMADDLDSREEL
jgi:hypothetical protein